MVKRSKYVIGKQLPSDHVLHHTAAVATACTLESLVAPMGPHHIEALRADPDLPYYIEAAREAEANAREMRAWLESLQQSERVCLTCGDPLHGRADRRYCSGACRVAAHRSR